MHRSTCKTNSSLFFRETAIMFQHFFKTTVNYRKSQDCTCRLAKASKDLQTTCYKSLYPALCAYKFCIYLTSKWMKLACCWSMPRHGQCTSLGPQEALVVLPGRLISHSHFGSTFKLINDACGKRGSSQALTWSPTGIKCSLLWINPLHSKWIINVSSFDPFCSCLVSLHRNT